MRRNLFLLLVTLLVMLVSLEIAARWLYRDITTTSDNGSYFARRWRDATKPLQNSLGFREREFAAEPEPGVYRIAVIGDSFTYGQGIRETERVTDLLEQHLDALDGRFEVLNFGRPGAAYERNTANIELAIAKARPDFLLLQWFINDLEDPLVERPRPWRLGGYAHRLLLSRSALYFLADNAWSQLQHDLGLVEPLMDHYRRTYLAPGAPYAARAEERLHRLLDAATASGEPFGMILWPDLWGPLADDARLDPFFLPVLDACRARGVRCLDLRPALRAAPPGASLIVNKFDAHPNPLANQLAAEATLQAFRDQWYARAAVKAASVSAR